MNEGAVTLRAPDGSTVRIDRFPAVLGRYHEDAPVQPDCDLSALDPESKISRQHLSLDWQQGQLMVTDLESSNGSTLDGRPLVARKPTPLRGRSVLGLGRLKLELEVETPASPAASPEAPADGATSPAPAGVAGGAGRALDAFVQGIFRAFADPAVSHLVVEAGRKVRVRRSGEWGQTGSVPVTDDGWKAVWAAFCRLTSIDPATTGYVATMNDEAVLVEVVRPPLAAHPVFLAQRRPAPFGLRNLAEIGAIDAASAAGLSQVVAAGEGVLVTGPARSGRTALLEALVDHVPRGARIVVVERRPMLRTVSPQVLRIRAAGGQGEAAVEEALALSPDWIVVDDALPGAAAAAAWLLPGGGTGLILGARTNDSAAWRARAADILVGRGLDRVGATVTLVQHLPISVRLVPADGRFRVEQIDRLRASAPAPAAD